jgi:hypothetical protein
MARSLPRRSLAEQRDYFGGRGKRTDDDFARLTSCFVL